MATYLLQDGVPPKVVDDILGHSRTGITTDIYSHVALALGKEAAESLGKRYLAIYNMAQNRPFLGTHL
ncbi:MAG: hypothetical protein GX881_01405 [Firmicutes bacterium]|nr:hypothetical protein [Bacillota bacterium]